MSNPSFYVLLPTGATPISGSIYCRGFGDHSTVCFEPKEGMTVAIYQGTEVNCKSFLGALMYRLSHIGHSFPVIDMRDFKGETND